MNEREKEHEESISVGNDKESDVNINSMKWRMRRDTGHSYKQRKGKEDEILSGFRKKKSALHGSRKLSMIEGKHAYYVLLDSSWQKVFGLIISWYFIAMILFALLSWPMSMGIECTDAFDSG